MGGLSQGRGDIGSYCGDPDCRSEAKRGQSGPPGSRHILRIGAAPETQAASGGSQGPPREMSRQSPAPVSEAAALRRELDCSSPEGPSNSRTLCRAATVLRQRRFPGRARIRLEARWGQSLWALWPSKGSLKVRAGPTTSGSQLMEAQTTPHHNLATGPRRGHWQILRPRPTNTTATRGPLVGKGKWSPTSGRRTEPRGALVLTTPSCPTPPALPLSPVPAPGPQAGGWPASLPPS